MATAALETLPKSKRIRESRDFQRIQRKGLRVGGRFLLLVVNRSRHGGRVGFAVGKNVGDAHLRNLVKRRLRQVTRMSKPLWQDLDVVVIAKEAAAKASFQQARDEFLALLQHAKIKLHAQRKPSS